MSTPTTDNAFLVASRAKLRFNTAGGQLTAEDLWDLNLKSLDAIAVKVDEALEGGAGKKKSFLANPDKRGDAAHRENELRLEILKTVIETKQAENSAAVQARAIEEERRQLKDLLGQKKTEELKGLSTEEIEKRLASLG